MPKPGERWSLLEHCKQDDDLLSFLFVDLGLFRKRHDKDRRITRKFNRDEFSTNASVVWDSYLDILKMVRAGELSPREGSFKLLKKGTIKTHLQKKRHQTEWNHFVMHVDRYMELFTPDSPFKLFETSRYIPPTSKKGKGKATAVAVAAPELAPSEPEHTLEPGSTPLGVAEGSQASSCTPQGSPARSGASTPIKKEFGPPLDLGVKSLRAYQIHERLRLYGSAADITSEEDQEMQLDQAQLQADFSVIYNQSKHCVQLFLGPGRFVNHDCNPNVELIRSGKGLCFKVVRPIEPNDELLTFYGSEYFGPNNENCLCLTCKKNKKGAYKKPEKPTKKVKVVLPEDPAARRTRSGHQPGQVASLRKQVHKANLVRTTVTITQGSRRSARTQTQEASTSSIVKARKAVRREITGTRKRKRSDSSSSEEDSEADVSYGSKRKVKTTKPKKGKKKDSARSDSSLTDVEDLDYEVNIEEVTFEETTVEVTSRDSINTDVVQTDSIPGDLALGGNQLLKNLISMSIPVIDGDIPSPLSGSTPHDFNALSPAPSDSIDGSSAPGTPSGFTLKLGEQLSSIVKGAGSLLHRAIPAASMASDTASQSQSSVFEAEEEIKE